MQGLIPEKHFDGGGNLQKDSGKADLATILRAMQNDFVASLGIKGVQTITLDDADSATEANASDEATSITLVNELKLDYNGASALANDVSGKLGPVQEVEISAPDSALVLSPNAVDLASVIVLSNDLKAKYNVMVALLNEMRTDLNSEGTVTISAPVATVTAVADASDQGTANSLLNDIKTRYNIAVTLVNEMKADLNAAVKITLSSRSLPFAG